MRRSDEPALDVVVGGMLAGRLRLDDDGRARFDFFEGYRKAYPRPMLGQAFEDDYDRTYVGSGGRLPAFFANFLPEGATRDTLVQKLGFEAPHDLDLLAELGEDLPGAATCAVPRGLHRTRAELPLRKTRTRAWDMTPALPFTFRLPACSSSSRSCATRVVR